MHLFVNTLSWNGLEKLQKLHPTLIKNLEKTGLPWTWNIRDNGSTDQTVTETSKWDNVKCYAINHNRDNFAQGMNYLFEQCQAEDDDLIMLLNNDMYFGGNHSIKNMVDLLSEDNVGLVGARLLYPESNRLQHAGVCFIKKYNYLPYHFKHGELSTPSDECNKEMQAVTGAIALIRAGDYKKICQTNKSGRPGLMEYLFWQFEDIHACIAVKEMGKKVMYCGKTQIFHEESSSLKRNPVNKLMMTHNVIVFRKECWGKYKLED